MPCLQPIRMILNTEIFNLLKDAFDIINAGCIKNVDQMQETLIKYNTQELLVEYARLFIGPFKMLAPPYSSLYFGSETLMSDETIWVLNFYRKLGLEFDDKIKNLPDHIAVETEFMYYLVFNEIKELEADNKKKSYVYYQSQTDFLNHHYKKWVPKFCMKVSNETNNEYYKALSACLNSFVCNVAVPDFPGESK